MDGWHALDLGDLLTAQTTLGALQDAVAGDVALAANPGCAIFTQRAAGDLHCEVTVYFSPAAAAIARSFGAHGCPAPGRRGLELWAGPESSWRLLAP